MYKDIYCFVIFEKFQNFVFSKNIFIDFLLSDLINLMNGYDVCIISFYLMGEKKIFLLFRLKQKI